MEQSPELIDPCRPDSAYKSFSRTGATFEALSGIVFSAALYGMAFSIVATILFTNGTSLNPVRMLVAFLALPFISGVFCFISSSIIGIVAILLVSAVNWSLRYVWHPITAGMFAAAITAYCGTGFFVVAILTDPPIRFSGLDSFLLIFFGPFTAMLWAQFCTIYFIRRNVEIDHRYRHLRKAAYENLFWIDSGEWLEEHETKVLDEQNADVPGARVQNSQAATKHHMPVAPEEPQEMHPLDRDYADGTIENVISRRPTPDREDEPLADPKITIRRVMIATVWIALFFCLAGAAGAYNHLAGIFVAGYVIFQAITFLICMWLKPKLIEPRIAKYANVMNERLLNEVRPTAPVNREL